VNIEYNITDLVDKGGIPQRLEENPHGSIEITWYFVTTMRTFKHLRTTKFMMNMTTLGASLGSVFLSYSHQSGTVAVTQMFKGL